MGKFCFISVPEGGKQEIYWSDLLGSFPECWFLSVFSPFCCVCRNIALKSHVP